MALTLKNLFAGGQIPPEITGELRTMLLQMRQERSAFEALLKRASDVTATMEQLTAPVNEARSAVRDLQDQVGTVTAAMPLVADLDTRVAGLDARLTVLDEAEGALRSARERAGAEVQEAADAARAVRDEVAELREMVGQVASVRAAVGELAGTQDRITAMRADVGRIETELEKLRGERDALRQQQETMRVERETMAGDTAAAREQLEQTVARFGTLQADVAEAGQRVAELRGLIDPVAELVTGVPEARRELQTLQALRDYVAQKVTILEEQRGLVDRAADRAERLGMLLQKLDDELRGQAQNLKFMTQLRESVDAVKTQHAHLLEDADELRAAHEQLRTGDATMRRDVGDLQAQITEELERARSGFAFERESLDAVSARVESLRESLTQAEQRFQPLEDAAVMVGEVRADAGHLAELVAEIEQTVSALALQGERVRDVEGQIETLEASASALDEKLAAIRTPSEAAIERADLRAGELAAQIDELEQRTRRISGHADDIRLLGQEVERQRLAVAEAMEQLRHASELKVEAGSVADQLGQRATTLAATLEAAEARIDGFQGSLRQLEARSDALDVARQAMDRFEGRLKEWQAMESRLGRAAAQVAERQGTVQVVRDDLRRMFALAEETADQVRAVAAARGELDAGRRLLDGVLPRLREVGAEIAELERRREAVAQDATQIARLEALLGEARASLAALESQKGLLDQVVSTAGALRFQTRQAEALVESLQETWERARG